MGREQRRVVGSGGTVASMNPAARNDKYRLVHGLEHRSVRPIAHRIVGEHD